MFYGGDTSLAIGISLIADDVKSICFCLRC